MLRQPVAANPHPPFKKARPGAPSARWFVIFHHGCLTATSARTPTSGATRHRRRALNRRARQTRKPPQPKNNKKFCRDGLTRFGFEFKPALGGLYPRSKFGFRFHPRQIRKQYFNATPGTGAHVTTSGARTEQEAAINCYGRSLTKPHVFLGNGPPADQN
jgi:hypothetical protein